MVGMTVGDWQVLISSVVGFLAVLAGGSKWLLTHIDALQSRAALTESNARENLSNRLHEEIRVLRLELAETHATNRLYLRRIYQLEAFIHKQPGIDIPDMPGWPPV